MSSRKVRVKKLNIKTTLPVLREDQIDPSEYGALTTESQIATGVEQAEENEYHLQTILKDAGTSNHQEIPVPPPQESLINYDELYPSVFCQPSSYIRFSQTVEECISCQYDMTTEDDNFLQSFNRDAPAGRLLSEDDFERILEVFEDTAAEQTPFASVDHTVVPYEMMVPALNNLASSSALQHAKAMYEYWRTRRQEMGNKPLHPSLKFETHQETDDSDPYVCFRRREARQTRKTRARDNKVAETLKRLRREIEDGRQLILMTYERELMKRDVLQTDKALFEDRARLKEIKVKLGVKGDDDDLVNQKPQKRKLAEPPGAQRPPGTQLRAPVRSDGRAVEQELVLLRDLLMQKERELREEIENKVQNHRRWNQNHIDLTRDPLSPVKEQGMELKFRPAKTQYLMTPPESTVSDAIDVDDAPEPMDIDRRESPVLSPRELVAEPVAPTRQPSFRRRIGRLQRLWIDRRGLTTTSRETGEYSDRWKYDSDDDDVEPPVYEVDPFDTRGLKFRAVIPLGQSVYRGARPPPPGLEMSSR
ncbi:Enhancer of polycomb-like protein [Ophiocordyceps camponoti-floridani]|uniref:Enhancer of polycomb-like protein n=1 Tax=Ophiocordyceps camponoti-floridani TaxID=2030778 RepID=A0A8H4Q4N4_9HYPO|nr:Enhancer of polycomb-like protein [Ophiocordyceps camponoti-floridani]